MSSVESAVSKSSIDPVRKVTIASKSKSSNKSPTWESRDNLIFKVE
jgi:hypothetical protein